MWSRMRVRLVWYALGAFAFAVLVAGSASAVTIAFDASQPGFPNPSTAVGTLEIDLSLGDLIASDTGGFLILLGVGVTAEATLTNVAGDVQSLTYALDPRFSTSTEQLLLQVELLAGNPAMLQLVLFDSAGWRGCILDPATCERRELFVSVPSGFGPGVAVGTTFDSDLPDHRVDVFVPEPATGLMLAAAIGVLALRRCAAGRARLVLGRAELLDARSAPEICRRVAVARVTAGRARML